MNAVEQLDPLEETQRMRALTALNILDTLPEERFDLITRMACRLFGVPIAAITMLDRDRAWNKSKVGFDIQQGPRAKSFCTHAIQTAETMVIEDSLKDPRFSDNPYVSSDPFVRFYAGRPVHGADYERVGTLCIIDHQPRVFGRLDIETLNDLGAMVDRELYLIGTATQDSLTHLANRRGFLDVAGVILRVCKRRAVPATVVTFDLDKFKLVNDTGGHAEGDRILRVFSKMLFGNFRESDVVARLGGDEFAVICSYSTLTQIKGSLVRLQAQFVESGLNDGYPLLGFSAGLAQYEASRDQSIEQLLDECDQKLYTSKQG